MCPFEKGGHSPTQSGGTARVAALLNLSADAHAEAGERDIFTPEYFVFARKP